MPYTYILECSDGSYYTGSTWNLEKRIAEHNAGLGAKYTKKHLSVKLIYEEYYSSIKDAFLREKEIQKWSHNKKKALVENDEDSFKEFSRKKIVYRDLCTVVST